MSETIFIEALLCVRFFFGGAVLELVYEIFRGIRLLIPHHKIALAVEDVVYLIGAGLVIFVMLQVCNDGSIRYYLVLSLLIGGLCVRISLSRVLKNLLKKSRRKDRMVS